MTPEERYNAVADRYNKNPRNQGLGAQLRSLFAAEGPEAAGTFVQIPGAEKSPGGRYYAFEELRKNLDFKNQDALKGYLSDLAGRTMGYDGVSIPVEGLVPDEGGFFGGGGPFISASGQQFGFGEDIAGLEKAYREIQDNAILPEFDQGLGTGDITKKKILEKRVKDSNLAERELLGEEAAFQPSALDEIGALITEAQNITKKPTANEIAAEEELRLGIDPPKETDFTGGGRGTIVEKPGERAAYEQQKIEEAFMAGMDDFILAARGENPTGPEKKTIEDYKREFSEATGIDVSGKVDKSQALMSFGLALMQNKAGKGFNLGKMLSSVGEAGEAAMPELAAARKEAKQASLSAGKFALQMQSSDESKRQAAAEKAMNRASYYIMPKGEGIGGFIKNMDKAKKQRLNVFELNALTTNPDFDQNYEIVSEASYTDLAAKAMEKPEAAEYYSSTKTNQVLFGGDGVDPIFTLSIFDVNPNVANGPAYGKLSGGAKAHEPVYRALSASLKDLNAQEEKLANAIAITQGGAATSQEQLLSWFKSVGSKLGVTNVEGNTATEQLKFYLKSLQVENASDILGESGKTLSDADRNLVKELIGDLRLLPFTGDNPQVIAAKLNEFRQKIIVKKRNEVLNAFRNLDGIARQDTSDLWGDSNWSEEDEAELLKRRKARNSVKDDS